jgi:hypothetical protein
MTTNASCRKHYKAGTFTPATANIFAAIFCGRKTRSRRDWLERLARDQVLDQQEVERKQAEARRRNALALRMQKQETAARNAKSGLFSRAMSWLRHLGQVA